MSHMENWNEGEEAPYYLGDRLIGCHDQTNQQTNTDFPKRRTQILVHHVLDK